MERGGWFLGQGREPGQVSPLIHEVAGRKRVHVIGDLHQAFEFGAQVQVAVFPAVKKGFDTQKVAGGQEPFPVGNDKGEDAVG